MALPQRINFYELLDRPVKDWFSLNLMLIFLAVFSVFTGVWAMFMVSSNSGLHKELSDVKHKVSRLQKNVDELTAVQQRSMDKRIFVEKIQRLKAEYASKARIVNALDQHPLEGGKGFSKQMKALANHTERGMWFTHISLADSGKNIKLNGFTRNPASIPRYLKALQREAVFQGHEFNQVVIRPDVADKSLYRFDLVTVPETE